jgi:hypothetical protein
MLGTEDEVQIAADLPEKQRASGSFVKRPKAPECTTPNRHHLNLTTTLVTLLQYVALVTPLLPL